MSVNRTRASMFLAAAALCAGCGSGEEQASSARPAAPAGSARQTVSLKLVARGFDAPLHVTAPRNEATRLYVVEQPGRIIVLDRGKRRVFLDIRRLISSGGERGLLSVAFHPRYGQNRRFYVNYTDLNGDTRVVEYRSNGLRAVLSTRRELFRIAQPYANHNGGQLAFGPDALLYVGMGDGGSGGDPEDRSQDMSSLLGKMLRIDVERKGAQPEIAALGLRNPWRFSFDRANGDLYIGDVGQNAWEEIDYTPRSELGRLLNYGWDAFEGRERFEPKELSGGELVSPLVVYPNGGTTGHCSVTGGFVYRGKLVPAARGRYYYGDFCTGFVWSLRVVDGNATEQRRERMRVAGLASFGENAVGELYLVSLEGAVYRLAR